MLDFSDLARSGTAPARYKPKSASKQASPFIYSHEPAFTGSARPTSRAGHDISDINIGLRLDRLSLGGGLTRERGCASTGDLPAYQGRNAVIRDGARHDDALGDRVRDYIKRKPINLASPLKRAYANSDELGLPNSARSSRRPSEDSQHLAAFGSPPTQAAFGDDEPPALIADRVSTKTSQRARASSAARYQPTSVKAELNARPRVRSANLSKKAAIAQTYLKAPTPAPAYNKPRRKSTSSKPSSARTRTSTQPVLGSSESPTTQERRVDRPLTKQRSFNEFVFKEGAAAERPPSRQKHAFPTHLADLDFRPQKAFETQSDSSQTNSLRDGPRMASSVKRPPSRHKPAGSGSVSHDGQRSLKHESSRSSMWQPTNHDPTVDGFADIVPDHPCPFVIQITNSVDERAARTSSAQTISSDVKVSAISPPTTTTGSKQRLATEVNEATPVDGASPLGAAFRRKRNEKSRSLQPTVKTINFDQHPAETSHRVYKTGSPPGIRPQQDPRVIRRGNDNKHNDSEIAEDVSSSPSASDDDECSVLTDITNPTDLRSETQQSLALESTLGEDFLSLFADGSELYLFESSSHPSWKQV